jgi:hypothetical protein
VSAINSARRPTQESPMKKLLVATAFAVASLSASVPARASLLLTAQGIADGFSLTTFATQNVGATYPFLAAAPLSDGTLAVVDYANGRLLKMADVDNQSFANIISAVSFPCAINIARVGGHTYAASQCSSGFSEVANNLSLTPVAVPGVVPSLGLWGNQVTGHLLAATNLGITDIDPLTGAHTVISANGADGISVSPDGTVVYAEVGGSILGYNIASHALVFNSGSIAGGPDGTGVISGGALNGHIIVNNNDGTVIEIDPTTNIQTLIATGGGRGDFTSPDSNDGSLLLSSYSAMYRLSIAGGSIGGSVPEPATLALTGFALLGLVLSRRRVR